MTFGELLESTLIKDEDIICVHRPMYGSAEEIRMSDHWFNDQILNMMDAKIDTIQYVAGNWDIHLQFDED